MLNFDDYTGCFADDARCPVQSFVRYKNMLPPGTSVLFPKVRKHPNKDGYYFDKVPMGHNKLGGMMSVLSEKAELSRKYTNHSLRATSVHVLDSAQVPSRHIMTVTGHKSETSLKTYTGYTDENTKKRMSHTISRSVGLAVEKEPPRKITAKTDFCENEVSDLDILNIYFGSCDVTPLSNSQVDNLMSEFNDDEFNALIREIPMVENYSRTNNQNISSTFNYSVPQWSIPAPVISGQFANVTINYQFIQK